MEAGGGASWRALVFAVRQKIDERKQLIIGQIGKPGMRLFRYLMVEAICARVRRLPTAISEGIAGGEPVIFSPWQTLHWLM